MFETKSSRLFGLGKHLLLHPQEAAKWTVDRLKPRTALELRVPWISYPCIDHLNRVIKPGMRVFEWGAGGSTLFFADRGCEVVSIETSEEWAEKTRQKLEAKQVESHVQFRLFSNDAAARTNAPAADYGRRCAEEVLDGGPWDLVLVDGEESARFSRVQCLEVLSQMPHRAGAMIVLDDAWRPLYEQAAVKCLSDWECTRFAGAGPELRGITRTDVHRMNAAS